MQAAPKVLMKGMKSMNMEWMRLPLVTGPRVKKARYVLGRRLELVCQKALTWWVGCARVS